MAVCEGGVLPIGGFQKHSLVDYPGRISAVIFTQGCNFRCIYCHNPQLVYPEMYEERELDTKDIFAYLQRHRGMLDALVITGGEPTLHHCLPDFIRQVKKLNLEVKLDTNGTNPEMLRLLLEKRWVDFVSMDIKTVLHVSEYRKVAGTCITQNMLQQVIRSISILGNTDIPVEFRTTVLKFFHDPQIIGQITTRIKGTLTLQNFRHVPGIPSANLYPVPDIEELKNSDD